MNQEELRLHRCCFTGHRPDKMELGEKEIKPLLEKAIDDAIADGYVTFIAGMYGHKDVLIGWRNKNAKFTNGFVCITFKKSVEVGQNLDTVAAVNNIKLHMSPLWHISASA